MGINDVNAGRSGVNWLSLCSDWAECGCFSPADLFSHLESSLLQGFVNYEVTRTTLEDVFLQLQGEEAIDPEGKALTPFGKRGIPKAPSKHVF